MGLSLSLDNSDSSLIAAHVRRLTCASSLMDDTVWVPPDDSCLVVDEEQDMESMLNEWLVSDRTSHNFSSLLLYTAKHLDDNVCVVTTRVLLQHIFSHCTPEDSFIHLSNDSLLHPPTPDMIISSLAKSSLDNSHCVALWLSTNVGLVWGHSVFLEAAHLLSPSIAQNSVNELLRPNSSVTTFSRMISFLLPPHADKNSRWLLLLTLVMYGDGGTFRRALTSVSVGTVDDEEAGNSTERKDESHEPVVVSSVLNEIIDSFSSDFPHAAALMLYVLLTNNSLFLDAAPSNRFAEPLLRSLFQLLSSSTLSSSQSHTTASPLAAVCGAILLIITSAGDFSLKLSSGALDVICDAVGVWAKNDSSTARNVLAVGANISGCFSSLSYESSTKLLSLPSFLARVAGVDIITPQDQDEESRELLRMSLEMIHRISCCRLKENPEFVEALLSRGMDWMQPVRGIHSFKDIVRFMDLVVDRYGSVVSSRTFPRSTVLQEAITEEIISHRDQRSHVHRSYNFEESEEANVFFVPYVWSAAVEYMRMAGLWDIQDAQVYDSENEVEDASPLIVSIE